LQNFLGLILEP